MKVACQGTKPWLALPDFERCACYLFLSHVKVHQEKDSDRLGECLPVLMFLPFFLRKRGRRGEQ